MTVFHSSNSGFCDKVVSNHHGSADHHETTKAGPHTVDEMCKFRCNNDKLFNAKDNKCTQCPSGSLCDGSSRIASCVTDSTHYLIEKPRSCAPCPNGYVCDGSATRTCVTDGAWFMDSSGACVACPGNRICDGSTNFVTCQDGTYKKGGGCPSGWTERNDHCYAKNPGGGGRNRHSAQQACQRFGAHLVTVNDESENSFVCGLFGGSTGWIGLTDQRHEGHWRQTDRQRQTE